MADPTPRGSRFDEDEGRNEPLDSESGKSIFSKVLRMLSAKAGSANIPVSARARCTMGNL